MISKTVEINAATFDARQALVRILRIIIGIVAGVTQEGAAVIASLCSLAAQLIHNGTTHNGRVQNIKCDIGGCAPNHILTSICAAMRMW